MNCPVCNYGEINEDNSTCPQCNSDLEAIHLASKIGRQSRNRFIFGTIVFCLSFLFLVFLIIGIINKGDLTKQNLQTMTPEEISVLKGDLENAKTVNKDLQTTNENLLTKLSVMETSKSRKEQIYLVREGETLFVIAREILGNGFRFTNIARDNNLSDPDKLKAGQKLIIYY
jgi:hypothetical protein